MKQPTLPPVHPRSLALLTDLYQLTMAQGYWKRGMAERESVFHLTFRRAPFSGRYAVACGLSYVVDVLESLRFENDDLRYLSSLRGADDRPLFDAGFLEYLGGSRFACDVDAIEEGTVVFAHQPLVRVMGPLPWCQIVETVLLNVVNFQTLVATKSARICRAAQGDPVIEFGLRRAQGIDGGLAASRAAFVGGCQATSNVLAGRLFDIPVKGTHAHSWVMTFDDERESFRAYADAMPNNCVFLVDTYDTLEGVRKAIEVGLQLGRTGHAMIGIRLDSGDLTSLSRESRRMLDEAGLTDAVIVASNDLDEYEITRLKRDGAAIDVWGVGTRLATAYDQPALGGVYKLSAIRDTDTRADDGGGGGGRWSYRLKLSEEDVKISNPGIQQVSRLGDGRRLVADVLYDEPTGWSGRAVTLDGRPLDLTAATTREDLLIPVFRRGERIYDAPSAGDARRRARDQLARLDPRVTALEDPIEYPTGLDSRYGELRQDLIRSARGVQR